MISVVRTPIQKLIISFEDNGLMSSCVQQLAVVPGSWLNEKLSAGVEIHEIFARAIRAFTYVKAA